MAQEVAAAPAGYHRAVLGASVPEADREDREMWVVRVPDGVPVHALDGVTLSLDALQSHGASAPLAEVSVDGDTYDLYDVQPTKAEQRRQGAEPSQLIDMAGSAAGSVFVDQEFFSSARSAGAAAEMDSLAALVPEGASDRFRVAPQRVHRNMLLTVRPPPSEVPAAAALCVPTQHTPHTQPWDRLTGRFTPVGAVPGGGAERQEQATRTAARTRGEEDARPREETKRKKHARDAAKSAKKKKSA
ncbi:hypothetical protein MSPP1_003941 [Malassezia sp. CBS 17886]|nr:hypothetical protein MSPP1_003941 [Malassezia sp. CBS 17886]